jgi:allophanate hydrolase subunit 1
MSAAAAAVSTSPPPRLHALGDAALVCTLPAPATLAQQHCIWALEREARRWPAVHETLPGMNNLTLLFDPGAVDAAELEIQVLAAWPQLAAHTGLSSAEVVRRHALGDYVVYLLGFLPGFPFMGGLPPELATPRRAEPRLAVPARSVGIGGAQTGVYPLVSPGGWRLIGRTPLEMFDPQAEEPTLLRAGDRVRFVVESFEP